MYHYRCSHLFLPVLYRGKEALDHMAKFQPLPHAGLPEHIGRAVVFLTSDSTGHFVTGTDFVIDGGMCLNPSFGKAAMGLP